MNDTKQINQTNQTSNINRFRRYIESLNLSGPKWDFRSKDDNIDTLNMYMLNRTQEIFKYENLPDTIPQYILEMYLQTNGQCIFTEVEGKYYIFIGGYGGEPNVYYFPTEYIVANPYLNFYKTLKINEECVLMRNDTYMLGLIPLLSRYHKLLVENELTIYMHMINLRQPSIVTASSDNVKDSAEVYFRNIESGKAGIIMDNNLMEQLKVKPAGVQGNSIVPGLIELEQYFKASLFNELGINANFNLKRESLTQSENLMNDDVLIPFIQNMLRCRNESLEKINEMYGLNIMVKLNSTWEKEFKELDLSDMFNDEFSVQTENTEEGDIDENT